jgi:hypothetical protein
MGFASPEHGAHALDLQHAQISSLPVTGVEQRYPPGHVVPQHSHARGHLIYASEGVLLVESPAANGWFLRPRQCGCARACCTDHGDHGGAGLWSVH